ncbi:YycH family regulatory protein [Staphylococcus petrasii]|uniref:YycH family regulatory protein n=1 Tax=Staphylococcus petrasii TaxID=1276936 RepID=UPI000CD14E7A|nr:two-component system activity regulator YycH [Staphylococcus petrasii]PNZ84677.1 hypothetical protein CD127_01550 [Staphylococcus petrasii]TGA81216.1 hypothetical protein E2554_06730 [Staphylococcus petrasii]SUM58666.1 SA_27: YycH protein [Staphylococcus petrasii]
MKSKEYIKSIILILLVMMSIVLTYMVWNFTPDLTNIDSAENKKSNVKSIGKPMAAHIDNVIAPYQMVEVKDDKVKGMAPSRAQLSQVTEALKNHEVSKIEHLQRDYNLTLPTLNTRFTVLDFTYDMPLTTYLGQVLNTSAKVPKDFNFNRLLVDENPKGNLELYAISKDRHQVMKVTMNAKAANFAKTMDQLSKDMQKYSEIITNKDTIDKATHVFAPSQPKHMRSYRMVYDTIPVETMNSILFDDSVIIRSGKSGATTYNNNTGVANYNDDSKKYHYKNLSEDESSSSDMDTTIPSTFEYINGHGGFFNDDFRLFSTDNSSGELTYQLFLNGHPTFNDQKLNEIEVTWGEKGIYDYKRALLRSSVPLEGESKSLDSAETVRSALANNHDIDFQKVTNMTVGYREDDQPSKDDIEVQRNSEFIPTWYVEYDGDWYAYEDGRLE